MELEHLIVAGKIAEDTLGNDFFGRGNNLRFSPCPQMVALWESVRTWARNHNLTEAPGIEKWVLSAGFRTVCWLGTNITKRSKGEIWKNPARDSSLVINKWAPSFFPDDLDQLRRRTELLLGYDEADDPALYGPSLSLLTPPTGLERTLVLDLFDIKRRELTKVTPFMKALATWCPVDQSREDFKGRVEEDVRLQLKRVPLFQNARWAENSVKAALMEANKYCDRVEKSYRNCGWRKPKERPELITHLEWTVRFQVKEETLTAIADSAQVEISTVKRGIDRCLDLTRLWLPGCFFTGARVCHSRKVWNPPLYRLF